MRNGKLGIGIVGCGAISQRRHAPEYAADPRCVLVGCTDYLPARGSEFASQYQCAAYPSLEALLEDPDIDAVSICTINSTHCDMAIAALHAGKHVLCEKPMAMSVSEAERMLAAARESGKLLIPAHNQRRFPGHIRARALLQEGQMGRVLSFESAFTHAGPEGWSLDGGGGWFFDHKKCGSGVIGDLAVHKADAIRWILGQELTSVLCWPDKLLRKDIPVYDHVTILCRTSGGVSGLIRASWCNRGTEENSTVICCENGRLLINTVPGFDLVAEMKTGRNAWDLGGIPSNRSQSPTGVIAAFLDAISGQSPFAIGADGAASAAFVEACGESAQSGQFASIQTMLHI